MRQLISISLLMGMTLAGCSSAHPIASKADQGTLASRANQTPQLSRVDDGQPAAPNRLSLGAGDALGQVVFARAAAIARAENPEGWRYAKSDNGDRAIFPAFAGHESLADVRAANAEDPWRISMWLDDAVRPVTAGQPNGDRAATPAWPQGIMVLVPE